MCTGPRSGLPVIVAVHSTTLGQAVGGCRLWHYADWRDGLADALRLSAGMTAKCAMAGLANGGGKAVVPLPEGLQLGPGLRHGLLGDIADVISGLDDRYATGPDAGTTPADMAVIGERTGHVFCMPPHRGGSGDPSAHTAAGTVAAVRAVCRRIHATTDLRGRSLRRGIIWVPDYVVGAGGVIYALTRELHHDTDELARTRVQAIQGTVGKLPDSAAYLDITPAEAAHELAQFRLHAAARQANAPSHR